MKERPILFSAPMVRAILDGRKTQTRRIVKPHPLAVRHTDQGPVPMCRPPLQSFAMRCPYGQPGDQLWVKETWRTAKSLDHCKPINLAAGAPIQYEADGHTNINNHESGAPTYGWGRIRQSIFMRRWMSRITLEIEQVTIERLQDISPTEALREGVGHDSIGNPKVDFQNLWQSINGQESWESNPWVWVITFYPTIK